MSKKADPKLSGRAVADEKGNQKWVWHSDADIDTAVVRSLGEGLTLDGGAPGGTAASGSNPYDSARSSSPAAAPGKDKEPARRRTLDDMRKLSESIKRSKLKTRE